MRSSISGQRSPAVCPLLGTSHVSAPPVSRAGRRGSRARGGRAPARRGGTRWRHDRQARASPQTAARRPPMQITRTRGLVGHAPRVRAAGSPPGRRSRVRAVLRDRPSAHRRCHGRRARRRRRVRGGRLGGLAGGQERQQAAHREGMPARHTLWTNLSHAARGGTMAIDVARPWLTNPRSRRPCRDHRRLRVPCRATPCGPEKPPAAAPRHSASCAVRGTPSDLRASRKSFLIASTVQFCPLPAPPFKVSSEM